MIARSLLAPAKLNLGLAIVGKRSDGYHDLVTIFQTVSIYDVLTVTPQGHDSRHDLTRVFSSDTALEGSNNLVVRAVDLVRARTGRLDPVEVRLDKEIPIASGLGGASSDAAAMLHVLNRLWNLRLSLAALREMALELGSDVPFFLRGGCAIGEGRGEILRPLPDVPGQWFVVVVPALSEPIPRKTASLFAALEPSDYRDGSEIVAQAARLDAGQRIDSQRLSNSFSSALLHLRPEIAKLRNALTDAGAPFVALSGAGPAHYTIVPKRDDADRIIARFQSLYLDGAVTFACTNVPAGASIPAT